MTKEKFLEVVEYISELINGSEFEDVTYVVGGAVRDFVMDSEIKDIDIVVELENGGIRFAKWMEENGYTFGSVVVYPTYGTAMFRMKEYKEFEIECVQTRKEQYKDKDSRNPETKYGTLWDDIMRRDLTINSLCLKIKTGEIVDVTGNGLKDIKEHRIRVTSTPNIVYEDDPLRILRCIRFFTKLYSQDKEWYIEEETLMGMYWNRERLKIVSMERIQYELNKIIMCGNPIVGFDLLKDLELLQYIIPELCDTINLTQNKYHIGDVYEHTMKVFELVSMRPYAGIANLETRMAALLHDIGKIKTKTIGEDGRVHFYKHEIASAEMVETILRRLKYSNDFIEEVKFLVANHMVTKQWGDNCEHMKDKKLRKLQYKCGCRKFFELSTLIHADNNAHAEGYCLPNQIPMLWKRTNQMIDDWTDMFDYELPIDGNDVMEVKGIEPGKDVRECLDYAMKLAYNNPRITREELLKHIKGYKLKK